MADASEQSNRASKILSTLEQCHSEGIYWDVQIRVDTEVFKCHRWLLAVNSEYFDTMFGSNFIESNTPKDKPITLAGMDATAFKELLHYMYTGEICINDSNVFPLLFMSDFLRLRFSRIKEQCLKHVKDRSQEDEPMSEALDLLRFTHLKGEKVFTDILNAHICRHLYHYSKDAQLMEISFEVLNALLEFSKGYILPLRESTDVLLRIVNNWINHNRKDRSQSLCKLIENIDLSNVSPNFVLSLMNRLEKADVVVNLSKDIESLSELKELVMGIDTNLTDGSGQFDSLISFRFEKVSKMQIDGPPVYSSSYIICDLSWKIVIKREDDELGMFLYCDGTRSTSVWNCYVSAKFTVVSHRKGQGDFVRGLQRALFASNDMPAAWGPSLRMKWNDLKDPANGYLNDDDSITLNIHVYADVPFLKMI